MRFGLFGGARTKRTVPSPLLGCDWLAGTTGYVVLTVPRPAGCRGAALGNQRRTPGLRQHERSVLRTIYLLTLSELMSGSP